jgi:phosphate transport system substrate-binding protein
MTYALMQNKAGAFVPPTAAAFAAAAAYADWTKAPANYLLLIDQPGATSWPISGATFILVYKAQSNPAAGKAVLSFFDWDYKNGDAAAAALDYVTLPAAIKTLMRKEWAEQIKGPDGKPVYVSK